MTAPEVLLEYIPAVVLFALRNKASDQDTLIEQSITGKEVTVFGEAEQIAVDS